MIINEITGDFYIGSASVSFKSRIGYHKRDLNGNKHHSPRLQNSWNKYGPEAFTFIILECCDKIDCIRLEQKYIDSLNPSFNICKVAGSCLGVKHSDETRHRMSVSKKGIVSPRKGVVLSEESKLKMSLAKKGKASKRKGTTCSEEAKLKMSESQKKRVRFYSQETRKKLSEAALKRWSK